MEMIRFEELELAAVEQDSPDDQWLAGFPFSPDRPGETTMEAADCTAVYNELDPGKRLGRHRDSVDEVLVVLAGTVEATCDSKPITLDAGSLTVIPANTDHAVQNVGEETAKLVGFFGSDSVDSTFEVEPKIKHNS